MPPRAATLRVKGYREFMKATQTAEKESKRYVRGTFRSVGDVVKESAVLKLSSISSRSAAGYKTRVRQRGVAVEQALPRTTGQRGDWGATQMRKALLPALNENEEKVLGEFEKALDTVADHFEQGP